MVSRRDLWPICVIALALAGCASELDGPDDDLGGLESGSEGLDASTGESGSLPDMAGSGDWTTGGDGDGDGDGDTGGLCDPTPSSWDPWIGGPCNDDLDCGYDGGVCLREDEGWPCGTCSLPCELYCPDVPDAPETFCVDQQLVDPFAPTLGACLQRCDPLLLPDGGCRPGYSCGLVERFNEPGTHEAVCLPVEIAPPKSECGQALDEAGLAWIPVHLPLDHPDTHPELDCIVDEPVRIYSPINGIDYRYISNEEPSPLLVSCNLALALAKLGDLLQLKQAVEVAHIGTYNCRVISGTDTLSEHAFARAIDLGGFELEDGTYMTIYEHWEDGVADPITFEGQWLKDLTDKRYEQMIFNIILTPNYNAAHDDHLHVDLTPDASFYE